MLRGLFASAPLRPALAQHDPQSRAAAERELEGGHDASFGRALHSDDPEQQATRAAVRAALGADARSRVEPAATLGERIEEEPRGGVNALTRPPLVGSLHRARSERETESRIPAGADVDAHPRHGARGRSEDRDKSPLPLRERRHRALRRERRGSEEQDESKRCAMHPEW